MERKELIKRYIIFIIGLFFSALGVALTKSAGLGVSPISSVPNVLSIRFTVLSMGNWLIVWNCLLIVGQILLLRKNFKPIQLLQVPLSFLFGYFTDFGMFLVSFIPADLYPVRLVLVIAGVAVLGFGIALAVIADVIMNSGEAFVKAVADTAHKDFGNIKILFDVSNVALSVILSLILFNFRIVGTREGTLIAALCTGLFVKLFRALLQKPLNALLTGSRQE